MAISVFPVPVTSSLNASAITAVSANTMYEGRATFDAAIYQITCASGTVTNFQFLSNTSTIITSGVTVSGTVSINLASTADRIRLWTDTGSNIVVTITKTAAALTNQFSGTLDTITTNGTYTGTSTSGYGYALVSGGGGGGGGGKSTADPGVGGGTGGNGGNVTTGLIALTGSISVSLGTGGAGGTANNSGATGGTTTFGALSATGGTGGVTNSSTVYGQAGKSTANPYSFMGFATVGTPGAQTGSSGGITGNAGTNGAGGSGGSYGQGTGGTGGAGGNGVVYVLRF